VISIEAPEQFIARFVMFVLKSLIIIVLGLELVLEKEIIGKKQKKVLFHEF